MRDRATADQLLEAAQAVLCDELSHALPPDKRHVARMIANATAIANRQLRNCGQHEVNELAELRRLLRQGETDLPARGADLAYALCDCNRTLCRWIRDGRADSGELRALLWTHLRDAARRRVAESNPDYLGASAQ